jgi:hypothetical protein
MRERQYTNDRRAFTRVQKIGVVPKHRRNHVLPGSPMKKRGLGTSEDERIPALRIRNISRQ